MPTASNIVVDGRRFNVFVQYPKTTRNFTIFEGPNKATAITGRTIRDVIGTQYSYSMTILSNEAYPSDYDDLYYLLSEPVDSHRVELPFGQTTIIFDAQIESGSDKYYGKLDGIHNKWDELEIEFKPIRPQRN